MSGFEHFYMPIDAHCFLSSNKLLDIHKAALPQGLSNMYFGAWLGISTEITVKCQAPIVYPNLPTIEYWLYFSSISLLVATLGICDVINCIIAMSIVM
ncbi:unnamed protein product [Prunus armeniaca]|uniref:Uncharacterized protein n=1 Tax=Prunus armeniaca TaxID=36596 RepID=A0A6J5UQS4_PRUAR|nr:unnamed protein product [Prunus armeniaca]